MEQTGTGSLRIYIAGPYSAVSVQERRLNVERAIDAGIAVFQKGHFPYVPHLTHFVDERATTRGIQLLWTDYLRWDEAWLELCDGILYLGPSRGADRELRKAREYGKREFRSVDEIPTRHPDATAE